MNHNIILNTDSYKTSHFKQYPAGTEYVYSYIEARKSTNPNLKKVVFFGLQAFIQEYLTKPINARMITEAEKLFAAHGVPFNKEGWEYILDKHQGYLPIRIQAVPEGTVLAPGNVLVQVVNTDPEVPWLTSYVETALLRAVWYPTTVASVSYAVKQILLEYARNSGCPEEAVLFKLHDFGARGVSSQESAALGGMAHLVNFLGTDTVSALLAAKEYYHEDVAGFSIPAAEHSTITTWGKNGELEAYKNMITAFPESSLVAVVSDSYDLFNAVDNIWGDKLKAQVLEGTQTLVVRPDSGDPTTIPVEVIKRLMAKFGYTTNDKGYKVLPEQVRVIQGDGITLDSIPKILYNMEHEKLSLENIAFGMGGGLLQQVNRDTLSFAMKACYAVVRGRGREVFKQPSTDGGKASKAGIQWLNKDPITGTYFTTKEEEAVTKNHLQNVFEDGTILVDDTLANIRARAQ